MLDPSALDHLSRADLIAEARTHGVERPERMTRPELKDEILRRTRTGAEREEARGFFGVARAMLASVVESGLNLPDAAAMIRGTSTMSPEVRPASPVATVTLAEIYAAQGHKKRALNMLAEVLHQEPDHEVALRLRRELTSDPPPNSSAAGSPEGGPPTSEEGSTGMVLRSSERPEEPAPVLLDTSGVEVRTDQPPEVDAKPNEPSSQVDGQLSQEIAPSRFNEPFLALETRGDRLLAYYELTEDAIQRSGLSLSEGVPGILVVCIWPSGSATERSQTLVPLLPDWQEAVSGVVELKVGVEKAKMSLRAAVGIQLADGFVPLSVGKKLDSHEELGLREQPGELGAQLVRARAAILARR